MVTEGEIQWAVHHHSHHKELTDEEISKHFLKWIS